MVTKQFSGPSRQRAQLLLREICHFLPRSLSFLRNSFFSASAVHLSLFVFIIYLSASHLVFFLSFSICSPATNFRGNGNQNVDFHVYNFLLHLLSKPVFFFFFFSVFLCLLFSFLFCLSTTRNIQMRRKCFFFF